MAITWTDDDKERLKKIEVIIHQQNIRESDLVQKTLPTDIHMVEYVQEEETYSDAVRAAKKSDIFDSYYDKLKEVGGVVISIRSGFGTIQPKMYNPQPKKKG